MVVKRSLDDRPVYKGGHPREWTMTGFAPSLLLADPTPHDSYIL